MKFLQKIGIKHKLTRFSVNKKNGRYKEWVQIEMPLTEVYFLGYRTLRNGYVDNYYEGGLTFNGDKTVSAALVIKNRTENPFYVPVETMKTVEENRTP